MDDKKMDKIGPEIIRMLIESGRTEEEIDRIIFENFRAVILGNMFRSNINQKDLQNLLKADSFQEYMKLTDSDE